MSEENVSRDSLLKEKSFEDAIEQFLLTHGGYQKGDAGAFDRALAIDKDTLLSFIHLTQPKKWEKYLLVYGSEAESAFIKRFDKEVSSRGLLDVLRKGFKDRGIEFRVCFFKPETSLNEDTLEQYDNNILHCTR